ncbi:DUF1657 domain-containing protein [Candidatus Formimonas warabiya]|uniref:DUF1657 domain-containing protein n=1 Tax=Formimonas warabiya TaxID=1761012 RepID=A0A3G1KRY5_FORW1|nr:DUF1657 domain-containing protein [Candidatus Formimonas warabiya]ATW25218.1 hypothetical protein DCMF_10965 [Candidatus Formimonas warabiya]
MTTYAKLNDTLYTLQGVANTLKIYAVQTSRQEIKDVFADAARSLHEVVEDLEGRKRILEFEEPQYKGQ